MNNIKKKNRILSSFYVFAIIISLTIVGCSKDKDKIRDAKIGDTIFIGKYDNVPLSWTVLNIEDNDKLLICDTPVAMLRMNRKDVNYNNGNALWNKSDLRDWLNNDFYNKSFSGQESKRILQTEIKTKGKKRECKNYNVYEYSVTSTDKVFLLSSSEVKKFFPSASSRKMDCVFWWLRDTTEYRTDTGDSNVVDYYVVWGSDGSIRHMECCNYFGSVIPMIWVK